MHINLRCPLMGTIYKHRVVIILLVVFMTLSIWIYGTVKEYQEFNYALGLTINEQTRTIQKVESENLELKAYVSKLEKENTKLKNEIKEVSEQKEETTVVQTVAKKDFKSYMPYTAITNKSSSQYQLQQQASTDINGIRCIDSRPMVAVGTGWGLKVGDTALVICENGNSFEVVVGDIKANAHTRADNKTTISNGCRCEFIVEMSKLNATVKSRGNMAVLEKYSGYITNIVKI